MANFSLPKPIAITVTSGVVGQNLVVRNRTTGETLNVTLGATAKCLVDLQNLTSGYTAGDVIDFMISGEKIGQTSLTLVGDKGQSVTLATSSITSGVSRGI